MQASGEQRHCPLLPPHSASGMAAVALPLACLRAGFPSTKGGNAVRFSHIFASLLVVSRLPLSQCRRRNGASRIFRGFFQICPKSVCHRCPVAPGTHATMHGICRVLPTFVGVCCCSICRVCISAAMSAWEQRTVKQLLNSPCESDSESEMANPALAPFVAWLKTVDEQACTLTPH